MALNNPDVVGFSPEVALKLRDMAAKAGASTQNVTQDSLAVNVVHGRVSTAASAGSLTTPTSGKFKVRDIGLAGSNANLSAVEVDFVNPYDGVSFAVDWDGLFVDTGTSWVPVYVEVQSGVGKGTLSSALATTNTTASITLDANTAVGTPGGSITANNFVGMEGAIGAKCYVAYDGTTWELIQISCPAA